MNFLHIWIISSLIVVGTLLGAGLYDGSSFVIFYCVPFAMLISISFLGLLVLALRILRVKSPINWLIPCGVAVGISLFVLWNAAHESYIRSDPENDFKRFVMEGPHWPDEDREQKYIASEHLLPLSVRVIRSKTFNNFDAEGAAVYFEIDKKDLETLLAQDGLTSSTNPHDWNMLNHWARWYLWINTGDLGASPTLYVKISNGNFEKWLMAVNHEQNRVLFLYLNVN